MALYYSISCRTDDPAGIKTIEDRLQNIKAILFHRRQLHAFEAMPEAQQAGVYLLYNMQTKAVKPQIYIGQTGQNIQSRLDNHNRNRDFWTYALVFVEKGDLMNMNSAHTKAIESMLIARAQSCNIAAFDNETGSNIPRIQDSDRNFAEKCALQMINIVKLLNLPFFDESAVVETAVPAPTVEITRAVSSDTAASAKPLSFTVGNKPIHFVSFADTLRQQCLHIIQSNGIDSFQSWVTNHTFFNVKTRKTFASKAEDLGSPHYFQLDTHLFLMDNYSAKDLRHIIDELNGKYPAQKTTLCYDIDVDAQTSKNNRIDEKKGITPHSFSITGKRYEYYSLLDILIKQCEMLIQRFGESAFSEKVICYPFFPKARRKTFAAAETDMNGYRHHEFSPHLYLCTNYDNASILQIIKRLIVLFPDFDVLCFFENKSCFIGECLLQEFSK